MSWLIVGISAFQHKNCLGKCPRRPGNKRDPGPTGAERARHDSGESPCVKPRRILARRSIGAHCVRRRLPAILPRLPSGASTPGAAALGDWVGFAVGWMAFASVVLSYGAVARALGRNLSYMGPSLSARLAQGALAAAVVAALALLNWRGVKPGAVASDLFSGAKLLPLLGFVAVGLFFIEPHRLAVPAPHGESALTALRLGGLAGLFACTGFEYVPVPAGE